MLTHKNVFLGVKVLRKCLFFPNQKSIFAFLKDAIFDLHMIHELCGRRANDRFRYAKMFSFRHPANVLYRNYFILTSPAIWFLFLPWARFSRVDLLNLKTFKSFTLSLCLIGCFWIHFTMKHLFPFHNTCVIEDIFHVGHLIYNQLFHLQPNFQIFCDIWAFFWGFISEE